jgi:acyl-CoA synthetase (AMP-forming)/AMP-acid ligase II
MFALVEEDVRGERMQVFAQRSTSIGQLLDASAAHGDTELMIFDGGPRITFAEHRRMVGAAAERLRADHGIGPGVRVAICAANSPGWVVVAMATLALGGVVVALNSWWSAEELGRALDLTEPALLVADGKRRAVLGAVSGSTPDAVHGDALFPAAAGAVGPGAVRWRLPIVDVESVLDDLAAGSADDAAPWPDVAEDDPAMLLFTSGTSGTPKAAVLPHRSLLGFINLGAFMGARSAMAGELTGAGGPRLAVFPLFHVSGFNPVLTALMFGGTTVWPVNRFDPGRVIELTKREGVSTWTGSATHISRLLDHPAIEDLDPTQIRQVGVGGSAATPSLIARVEDRFPHLAGSFSSGYGLTESGGLVSYASEAMLTASPDCVGYPLPTIEVKIVDAADAEVPDGETGFVCVRSPLVMHGYWRNPEADAAAFLPGRWLRTEDVGRLEDGLLHIASRRRDLIIRGGENVYPAETEDCLDRHPDVVESAVFGVDDHDLGQVVHAAVVMRPGADLTAEELQRSCAERLAYFKVPSHITFRSEPLPRNATGKVLKHLLERDPHGTTASDPG